MIRIFQPNATRKENITQPIVKKISPAAIRLKKDMEELDPPPNAKTEFPNPDEPQQFYITIIPGEYSLWNGGTYKFNCEVPEEYPHEPPKLECQNKIFHPNIDLQGKVCLNILRADWKPIFNINTIIMGLNSLFDDPNPNDPLNKEAGELMRNNVKEFEDVVKRTLRGYSYKGESFPKFTKY